MSTVAEILEHRRLGVLTISAQQTVFAAISQMVKRNVGSIVVTDDANVVRGIFTERDCLRRIVIEGRAPKATSVGDVMSRDIVCVEPHRSIDECMAIMTNEHIRHIPVVEDGLLVGIVSIGDLVKHRCEERAAEVKNLTDYITGRYPGEVSAEVWGN